MTALSPLTVPDTRALFKPLRDGLLTLLRSLEPEEWDRPTVAGAWRVRDVVAHLLDGELRTLAAHRDGHSLAPDTPIRSYDDVVALIQRLNSEGVAAGRHSSPRLLVDLLAVTGEWMHAFLSELDPNAPALFAVAWAGEEESTNRFDTAREYTERWHHEMQIRAALGRPAEDSPLLGETFGVPLLETALHALPHAYRSCAAADASALVMAVEGPGWQRSYCLRRDQNEWRVYAGAVPAPTARVVGSADAWWRLFFNALPDGEAANVFTATGSDVLLGPLWKARSVMV